MRLMKMRNQRVVAAALTTCLMLTGCGTLLHPERKGQISGRIDPAIAALNGVGLLFFFVPGVIAFAVDFSNGTIYLPAGRSAANGQSDTQSEEVIQISFEGHPDRAELAQIIQREAGLTLDLAQAMTLTPNQYLAMAQKGDTQKLIL